MIQLWEMGSVLLMDISVLKNAWLSNFFLQSQRFFLFLFPFLNRFALDFSCSASEIRYVVSEFNHSSRYFLIQSQQWKHEKDMWILWEANNKDTRMASYIVLVFPLLPGLWQKYELIAFICWVLPFLKWIESLRNMLSIFCSFSHFRTGHWNQSSCD